MRRTKSKTLNRRAYVFCVVVQESHKSQNVETTLCKVAQLQHIYSGHDNSVLLDEPIATVFYMNSLKTK